MAVALSDIATLLGGRVRGNPDVRIAGAAPFDQAGADQITFAVDARYLKRLDQTKAAAVIVGKDVAAAGHNLVTVDHPQAAFARVLGLFYPPRRPAPGISPLAAIADGVALGADVSIGPFAVVGRGSRIGERTCIGAHVVIGEDVVIGNDAMVHPRVTVLDRCRLGSRVTIWPGTVIGSDGFGFAPEGQAYVKIPHQGIVAIGDDVEIGACNTIDRATFGETRIGNGVKTDNLVHVAHNVTVGDNTLLVSQVGVSGSVTIGRHAILAGQAGIAQHLTIGDNAIVGPQAGVGRDVPAGTVVSGSPEIAHKQWLRVQRVVAQLPEIKKTVDALARRMGLGQSSQDTPARDAGGRTDAPRL